MSEIKLEITVNASKDDVWDVLFNQYGNVNNFNPVITSSHHTSDKRAEIGCERKCEMPGGKYVNEKITSVTEGQHFDFVVTGNIPMVKQMNNSYGVTPIADKRTLVKFTADVQTSPSFMVYMMKPMIKGMLNKMMVGLKYYLETGEKVDNDRINEIVAQYKQLEADESMHSIDADMSVA